MAFVCGKEIGRYNGTNAGEIQNICKADLVVFSKELKDRVRKAHRIGRGTIVEIDFDVITMHLYDKMKSFTGGHAYYSIDDFYHAIGSYAGGDILDLNTEDDIAHSSLYVSYEMDKVGNSIFVIRSIDDEFPPTNHTVIELNILLNQSSKLAQQGQIIELHILAEKAYGIYLDNIFTEGIADVFSSILNNLRIITYQEGDYNSFMKYFQWQKDLLIHYPENCKITNESLCYYSFHIGICSNLNKESEVISSAYSLFATYNNYNYKDMYFETLISLSDASRSICRVLGGMAHKHNWTNRDIKLSQLYCIVFNKLTQIIEAIEIDSLDDREWIAYFHENAAVALSDIMLLFLQADKETEAVMLVNGIARHFSKCRTSSSAIGYAQALFNHSIYCKRHKDYETLEQLEAIIIKLRAAHPETEEVFN